MAFIMNARLQSLSSTGNPRRKPRANCSSLDLLDLQVVLVRDVMSTVGLSPDRDIATIINRYRHEGSSFLTKTLPKLDASLKAAFQSGSFECPTCFKLYHSGSKSKGTYRKHALPSFLKGLLSRIFDSVSGELLISDTTHLYVRCVTQITTFLKKYEVTLGNEAIDKQKLELLTTDSSLPSMERPVLDSLPILDRIELCQIINSAQALLDDVFNGVDLRDIVPKQGPGACATPTSQQHDKFRFLNYSSALDRSYPKHIYTEPSFAQARESSPHIRRALAPFASGAHSVNSYNAGLRRWSYQFTPSMANTSKVAAVPKTAEKVRIISAEPESNQWIQQGQWRVLKDVLERHELTRGHINFRSQGVNQAIALSSSRTGKYATLDWSEASDRVSWALVKAVLPYQVFAFLDAARSAFTRITWSDGGSTVTRLRKFAPMGSGVCFPIESLIFWALSVSTISVYARVSLSEARKDVFVYGDDTIVLSKYRTLISRIMPKFGLKLNERKSFSRGPFRESCGVDAFNGFDVTPVKLKKTIPRSRGDAAQLMGWSEVAAECFSRQYFGLAEMLYDQVERTLGCPLPDLPYECGILGRVIGSMPTAPAERHPASEARPFFQGRIIGGYSVEALRLEPSVTDFPEDRAWLRWASYAPNNPADEQRWSKNHHADMARRAGSHRVFAVPHRLKLRFRRVVVT